MGMQRAKAGYKYRTSSKLWFFLPITRFLVDLAMLKKFHRHIGRMSAVMILHAQVLIVISVKILEEDVSCFANHCVCDTGCSFFNVFPRPFELTLHGKYFS